MNRDDWLAAILVIALITIAIIIGLYASGFWNPERNNAVLPFIQNRTETTALSIIG